MGKRFLVVLDTDHIKQYVFATDMLKEIRGASSILDDLNRRAMIQAADAVGAKIIYANGGSGQFVLQSEEALKNFAQRIQHAYREQTRGGASIAVATQEIPTTIPDEGIENNAELHPYLRLLQYRLLQAKGYPHHDSAALPSHPLMRLCDSCGTRYAEKKYTGGGLDPVDQERRYCNVCLQKRHEDHDIKKKIEKIVMERASPGGVKPDKNNPFAWEQIIAKLTASYKIPVDTDRPSDFNKFQRLSDGYLALIYADANSMGEIMDELPTIKEHKDMAEVVDSAIYAAMSAAIAAHLSVVEGDGDTHWMFPFDILMIGGDDIMIVTPADVALDVALTLAKTFHQQTKVADKKGCSLSIGVILAPVKYPFGLLQELAETTLKFAKKTAAKKSLKEAAKNALKPSATEYGDTLINFMTVTGSNSLEFKKVYDSLHEKHGRADGRDTQFYATLRPYTVEQLTELLRMIREGKQKRLGRTKLHQVREAVLHMNLTTSVSEGLAVLSNWRGPQREFVVGEFYKWANGSQEPHCDAEKPETQFPRVTFPWFADGPDTYRTFLLDFVELYDFVGQKEVEDGQ